MDFSAPFERLLFDSASEDLPLLEPLGLRQGVACFESDFSDGCPESLSHDIAFLKGLGLTECAYGAAACKVYPFVCSPRTELRTARNYLEAIRAKDFKSDHIKSLDQTHIPFPGYHPDTNNDEIHSDPSEQNLFTHGDEPDETTRAHESLKMYVRDQHLWYILLHMAPKPHDEFMFSEYVLLLAVGRSKSTNTVIGVVSHQVCHNLCD